jgi:hypothetical protein
MSETDPEVQRIAVPEQVAALAYAGNVYGLLDRPGVQSTHRESDLLDRLRASGYEIVRVKPAPGDR